MEREKLEQDALEHLMEYLTEHIKNRVKIIRILRAADLICEDLGYQILNEESSRKQNHRLLQELNKIAHFSNNISHLLSLLNSSGNNACAAKLEQEVKRRKDLPVNKDLIFQNVLGDKMNDLCKIKVINLKKLVMALRQKHLLTEEEGLSIMGEDTPYDKSLMLFTLVKNKKIKKEVLLDCLHVSENFKAYYFLQESFENWNRRDSVGNPMLAHNHNVWQGRRVDSLREDDYVTANLIDNLLKLSPTGQDPSF